MYCMHVLTTYTLERTKTTVGGGEKAWEAAYYSILSMYVQYHEYQSELTLH